MGAAGLVGCLCGRGWPRVFLALRAAIGVLWVRGFLPPFFLLLPVFPWVGGRRKVAAWGECLVFSFRVGCVVDYGCEVACEW